jgi:hypothetical protein
MGFQILGFERVKHFVGHTSFEVFVDGGSDHDRGA